MSSITSASKLQTVKIERVVFNNDQHRAIWFEIRNDAAIRKACRSTKKITVEQHRDWWQKSAASEERQLFFVKADCDGDLRVVGLARLDHRKTWIEVFIAVKPQYQRRHIASQALQWLIDRRRQFQWPPLGAVINGQDPILLRLCSRAGLVLARRGFVQVVQQNGTTHQRKGETR